MRSGGPKQDKNTPGAVKSLCPWDVGPPHRASSVLTQAAFGCLCAAQLGAAWQLCLGHSERYHGGEDGCIYPKSIAENKSGCATCDTVFPFGVFSFPSLLG